MNKILSIFKKAGLFLVIANNVGWLMARHKAEHREAISQNWIQIIVIIPLKAAYRITGKVNCNGSGHPGRSFFAPKINNDHCQNYIINEK